MLPWDAPRVQRRSSPRTLEVRPPPRFALGDECARHPAARGRRGSFTFTSAITHSSLTVNAASHDSATPRASAPFWGIVQRSGLRALNPPIQVRILVSQPRRRTQRPGSLTIRRDSDAAQPCIRVLARSDHHIAPLFRSSTTAVYWPVTPRDPGSNPGGGAVRLATPASRR